MTWVAGADGFKNGWYVVLANLDTDAWSARVVPSFAALLELPETPSVVCVDMPIGLPEHTPPGGRQCEAMARSVLGPRRSSVFSAVGRQALGCASRAEADGLSTASGGIGIGAQAWGLAAKLREVDDAMTVERQAFVFEVHPEVSFWAMNGRCPMAFHKSLPGGESERIAALARNGVPGGFIEQHLRKLRSGRDDFLDACAAAWTALRIRRGTAGRFPALSCATPWPRHGHLVLEAGQVAAQRLASAWRQVRAEAERFLRGETTAISRNKPATAGCRDIRRSVASRFARRRRPKDPAP